MDASRILKNKHGVAFVWLAASLVAMFAIAALVIDISRLYVVRSELQNAADAAALSGAMRIYSSSGNPSIRPTPRWNEAKATAEADISLNKSDGQILTLASNGEVQIGFWNTSTHSLPLRSPASIPTAKEVPAVQVRVFRESNSSVPTIFWRFIAQTFASAPVTSRYAIAVRGFPSKAEKLFPIAMTQCLADNYFAQNPLPDPPTTIRIYSTYTFPNTGVTCETGQWTSFLTGNNDAATIKDLINNGTSGSISVGESIWIEPGAKTSIFNEVTSLIGTTVLIPVVDTVVKNDATHAYAVVKGFAAFVITAAVGGTDKYVEGHFTTFYETTKGTAGGGEYYGAITPPLLVY